METDSFSMFMRRTGVNRLFVYRSFKRCSCFSSFSSSVLLCDHPPPPPNCLHCLSAGSAHEETCLLGFPVFLRAALESWCLNTTAVALLITCTRQDVGEHGVPPHTPITPPLIRRPFQFPEQRTALIQPLETFHACSFY